jgi:hypothetical protein
MERKKYIGMDVHQAGISIAVRDDTGKLVMEGVIETKATWRRHSRMVKKPKLSVPKVR